MERVERVSGVGRTIAKQSGCAVPGRAIDGGWVSCWWCGLLGSPQVLGAQVAGGSLGLGEAERGGGEGGPEGGGLGRERAAGCLGGEGMGWDDARAIVRQRIRNKVYAGSKKTVGVHGLIGRMGTGCGKGEQFGKQGWQRQTIWEAGRTIWDAWIEGTGG